jgi:hypothetical protein
MTRHATHRVQDISDLSQQLSSVRPTSQATISFQAQFWRTSQATISCPKATISGSKVTISSPKVTISGSMRTVNSPSPNDIAGQETPLIVFLAACCQHTLPPTFRQLPFVDYTPPPNKFGERHRQLLAAKRRLLAVQRRLLAVQRRLLAVPCAL